MVEVEVHIAWVLVLMHFFSDLPMNVRKEVLFVFRFNWIGYNSHWLWNFVIWFEGWQDKSEQHDMPQQTTLYTMHI